MRVTCRVASMLLLLSCVVADRPLALACVRDVPWVVVFAPRKVAFCGFRACAFQARLRVGAA